MDIDVDPVFIYLAAMLTAFVLEIFLQGKWINAMHSMKIEQVTKLYGPAWQEKAKMGTPAMGGLVFIPAIIAAAALGIFAADVSLCDMARLVSYPVLAAAVGFLDDWLKHSKHSSDGLTSRQKLLLQLAVTVPWAIWTACNSSEILMGISIPPVLFFALVTFAGVGLQNAVNVTDGLDGLAAGCSLISFIAAGIYLHHVPSVLILAGGCGICLGFLWHNANPASVFMGDVGAHFLAGLLLSACVNSGAFVMVIPFSFLFGIEILSVTIQIIAIRRFKRKVFKMSPIHHHFEMSGWKESQIVTRFWILHIIGVLVFTMLVSCAAALYCAQPFLS